MKIEDVFTWNGQKVYQTTEIKEQSVTITQTTEKPEKESDDE